MSSGSPLSTASGSSTHNIIHAPVPQQQLPPLSLLNLPQELRDQIYDKVFEAQDPFEVFVPAKPHQMSGDKNHIVFVVSCTPQNFTAISNLDHRRPRGMKWILANKQICQEAIEQFHRQATWNVIDTEFRGTSGRTSPWSQPHHLRHTSFLARPLVPISARHIVVHNPIAVSPRPEGDLDGKPRWHLKTDWHSIDRFVMGLSNTTELQVLSIALCTNTYSMQKEALEQAPDDVSIWISTGMLNVFKAPDLRKLEFNVDFTPEFEARKDFVLAWEKHLDGLGAILIGDTTVRTSNDIETSPRKTVYTYTRS